MTFLFPDHTTALTGTFSKSEMLLGQVSFIQVNEIRRQISTGSGCIFVNTREIQVESFFQVYFGPIGD